MIIVAGKGGVGRTTVAVALGLALARRGRRTLLAHVRCKQRLAEMLGCETVDQKIRQVAPQLWAVNMEPRSAIREMGLLVLRYRALYKVVLENRLVRSFLRAVPALEEYSMIGKAWYHTTEKTEAGESRYETVIFDGPATGHLISMLRIPQVILETVPEGPLTRDAHKAYALLRDPQRTVMWLVTLAEELAVSEAVDLYRAAGEELGIAVEQLVVNALYPGDLTATPALDRALLAARSGPVEPLREMMRAVETVRQRRAINDYHLSEISRQIPLTPLQLPHLFADQINRDALAPLIDEIDAALERAEDPVAMLG
jgi:anion-transporting  ArsA/GET3 family ATPase